MKKFLPLFLLSAFVFVGCNASASEFALSWPLERAAFRQTPLSFGLYVTPDPAQNPIDPPERFTGYHVGIDFEITSEEQDIDVPVFAMCTGEVFYSGFAEGYGGLISQRCTIDEEPVVILYGHLLLSSLPEKGTKAVAGSKIALLAPAKSHDSDDNRKHLHLGIHKGTEPAFLGYVQSQAELGDYMNAWKILKRWGVMLPYSE